MEIRNMSIGDYQQVRTLWDNTAGMGLRILDDSHEGIEKFLMRNPRTCFVAAEGNDIVGSILCGHDGRRGYIYHAAVLPSFRHLGIGTKLVDAVKEALVLEGIHKAALVVFADNTNGQAFWRSVGWEERTDLKYFNISLNAENQ